jgi:hypothetical protein
MATRTTETGTLAADAIGELFDDVCGGREPGHGTTAWEALVDSEWPSAAHVDAGPDDTLDLRAIQEIARVTGRYASVTPIISTLLASTWFRDQALPGDRPILIALPRDGGSVAVDAAEGALLVSADGLADAPEATVERFAPSADTHVFADIAAVEGDRLAQTYAVLAAIAVGCADAVIDKSTAWAGTREQFGQPIARFQAVRHHLANMHIAREQSWTAAIVTGIERDQAARWATMAVRLARRAIELGVQVHGGVGFTVEVGLDAYLKRVLEIESVLGGTK